MQENVHNELLVRWSKNINLVDIEMQKASRSRQFIRFIADSVNSLKKRRC